MKDLEIDRSEWRAFIESFSVQHRKWLTTIKVVDKLGKTQVVASQEPLEYVTLNGNAEVDVGVAAERGSARSVEYPIRKTRRIVFEETEDGAHKGMRIESVDGVVTFLEFRIAVRPKTLDGKI